VESLSNPHVEALGDAFKEHIPDDARFFFAMVDRQGHVSTLTSINDPEARADFLFELLMQAKEAAGREGGT
jgi:hypothetical protein